MVTPPPTNTLFRWGSLCYYLRLPQVLDAVTPRLYLILCDQVLNPYYNVILLYSIKVLKLREVVTHNLFNPYCIPDNLFYKQSVWNFYCTVANYCVCPHFGDSVTDKNGVNPPIPIGFLPAISHKKKRGEDDENKYDNRLTQLSRI